MDVELRAARSDSDYRRFQQGIFDDASESGDEEGAVGDATHQTGAEESAPSIPPLAMREGGAEYDTPGDYCCAELGRQLQARCPASCRWPRGWLYVILACAVAVAVAFFVGVGRGAGRPDSEGATVSELINATGCSTLPMAGLSAQLVDAMGALHPGLMSDLSSTVPQVHLDDAAAAVPYLQSAAAAALHAAVTDAARDGGARRITINSALRTLPQQLALYEWWRRGDCGISLAAAPGASNHNGGIAIDVENATAWVDTLEAHEWEWLGQQDRMHFNYVGVGSVDVRDLSVLAFQMLWNCNHGEYRWLVADGLLRPEVTQAMLESPVDGMAAMCVTAADDVSSH